MLISSLAPDTSTFTDNAATLSSKDVGPVTLIYVGDELVEATVYPEAVEPVVLTSNYKVLVSLLSMLSLSADVLGTASTLLRTCPSLIT